MQRLHQIVCVIGVLFLLVFVVMVNSCDHKARDPSPAAPAGSQTQAVDVSIPAAPMPYAKAVTYSILAVGLDDNLVEIGPTIGPITIENPVFPLTRRITVFVPPCLYRITIGLTLTRDPAREWSQVVNTCDSGRFDIPVVTFEEMRITGNPIHIEESGPVLAGTPLHVRCITDQVSAPDSDRYPLSAELFEVDGGDRLSGPFGMNIGLSGLFPDPFPQTSKETDRFFRCIVRDGRSPTLEFEQWIERLPDVDGDRIADRDDNCPEKWKPDQADGDGDKVGDVCDNCPMVANPDQRDADRNGRGDLCDPCTVKNENDSNDGSLRETLAYAPSNQCETITFTAGVTRIVLTSGQLTPPVMTLTINGGSGVTISGNNASRVFWVNAGSTITFAGLTITQGMVSGAVFPSGWGGGIHNSGGTIIIAGNTVVRGNAALYGGGIHNNSGMLTVNGSVSNNNAQYGGGIDINAGTVIINGRVNGNTNVSVGGGGGMAIGGGIVTINGEVNGNTTAGVGGGINNGGILTVNGTVSGNTAASQGGGMTNTGTVIFGTGNVIQNNQSFGGVGSGGGIYRAVGIVNPGGNCTGNTPENYSNVGAPFATCP